ncbi:MAG TPA: TIGR03086 family metal-binding protein [Acidimicrobiia bacterium]|jgi:uncharacterized protein (TIGR03086 family)|nr:TIGR03086 family metal-binding protein [Acidimicrobiia bacterium]
MDELEALVQTFDHATKVVAGITDDELGNPTPCQEWDVRTVLTHMTGVVANMGLGASALDLLPDITAYELRDDRVSQFRSEADRTLAAWTKCDLSGEVNVGAGPMPVAIAMRINVLDTATHSWDIARATGQGEELPDELAKFVLGCCEEIVTDQLRGFAGIDPAVSVAADANPTQRLVAFLGRQP